MVISCIRHLERRLHVRCNFCSAVTVAFSLSLSVLFFIFPADSGGGSKGPEIPDNISGKVVYQRNGGIYIQKLESDAQPQFIVRGSRPRWSPHGTDIGYISGNRIMLISERGGTSELIATAVKARALTFSPDGRSLFYTDGTSLQNVKIKGHEVTTVVEGYRLLEVDAAGAPVRIAATVRKRFGYSVFVFDLQTGRHRAVATGCSASLSPDGGLVTVNGKRHRFLNLHDWNSLSRVGRIAAPAGEKFDNQLWSNSPHWLVSMSEKNGDLYIHQIQQKRAFRLTWTGGCDRPDLFIERSVRPYSNN
ncbi:MAG: hypothetical protein JRJ68_00020 [Deltaproteobacteria bacterium]|nr:hypothetical protein [Deltaproteobacteria bacterium]